MALLTVIPWSPVSGANAALPLWTLPKVAMTLGSKIGLSLQILPEFLQLSLPHSTLRRSRYDSGSRPFAAVRDGLVPRSQPPLAIRRLSATIRQDRSPSQAPGATPAALPRSHRRRLLPPLTAAAYTPLPHLRGNRSRSRINSCRRHYSIGQIPNRMDCTVQLELTASAHET